MKDFMPNSKHIKVSLPFMKSIVLVSCWRFDLLFTIMWSWRLWGQLFSFHLQVGRSWLIFQRQHIHFLCWFQSVWWKACPVFFRWLTTHWKPNTQMISLPPAGWVIFHFSVNADHCWGTSGLTRTTKPRGCHSDCWGILLYILSIENLWPECSGLYGYSQLKNSVFADSSVWSHKEGWVKSALWGQVLEEAARDARLTSLLHTFQKSKKW
jgi:hypothetical protein